LEDNRRAEEAEKKRLRDEELARTATQRNEAQMDDIMKQMGLAGEMGSAAPKQSAPKVSANKVDEAPKKPAHGGGDVGLEAKKTDEQKTEKKADKTANSEEKKVESAKKETKTGAGSSSSADDEDDMARMARECAERRVKRKG
jgi:hypothetical protein